MREAKLLPIALALSASLLVTGCADQPRLQEVDQRLNELRERPSGRQIEALPEFPEPLLATYTQSHRRDPFTPDRPIVQTERDAEDSGIAPDLDRIPSELERYELDSLALRGIMRRGNHARALLMTPEQRVVSVHVGDYIGRNHGRITQITATSVMLTELISDNRGRWQEREQQLTLSR